MEGETRIILAGSGGQGLSFIGVILARSFVEQEGKNVVQTESYGISMRGGHSRSEVIVSTNEIDDISISEPNILLALSQEAADVFGPRVNEEGSTFLDSDGVSRLPETKCRTFSMPFIKSARELGNETLANVVALGAMTAVCSIIRLESLKATLQSGYRSPGREHNMLALELGHRMGQRI